MPISRRRFLGLAGGMLGAAVGADACFIEPKDVEVTRHNVPTQGLDPALDGIRIAQVTDVHLPANGAAAGAVLSHLRRERPEVVVLIGDMTERADALPEVAAFAAAARGTVATFATLGNWEYHSGAASDAAEAYRGVGVELLVNARREVAVGGASLVVVGLDDPVLGTPDIVRARAGLSAGRPEVWLIHAPGFVGRLRSEARPAMVLAGHTHGGQIRLPLVPPITPTGSGRFVAGWYRDTFSPLYVSRGVGTAAIRARFRCPPELPIFTLHPA